MASANTINSLESIEKKTIYSKYGENLNRIFKSRSLKSLIWELKNPKKISQKELFEASEFQKKKPKENKEENYTDIFDSMIQYLKKEAKKENQKVSIPYKPKIRDERDIIEKHEFKDPFKYNPNYNAISKNVPSVKMILTEREKKEMQKKQEESKRNRNFKLSHSKTESNDKNNKIVLEIIDENSKPMKYSPKSRNMELPIITKVPKQYVMSYVVFSERCKLKVVPDNEMYLTIIKRNRLIDEICRDLDYRNTVFSHEAVNSYHKGFAYYLDNEELKKKHRDNIDEKKGTFARFKSEGERKRFEIKKTCIHSI